MTSHAPLVSEHADYERVFPGLPVIDCDAHITEPADLWTSRGPASMRHRLPTLREVNGQHQWFVDGDIPLGSIGLSVIGRQGRKQHGMLTLPMLDMMDDASWDPAARVAVLDRMGIQAQILYPNVAGFGSSRFLQMKDDELRMACVQIYNDYAAEIQANTKGRLVPQAILPLWSMPATLREMQRARGELKLTGVTIPDTPERLGLPDFGNDHWIPFWECASELGLPLNFHIGSADVQTFINAPWTSMGPERRMAIGATMLYMDNARVIVNLLYSDIIERFPKLRFVSVESGLGWIPFVLEACEYQWDEMVPTEVKHHRMRPTEKFRQAFYACFWFEENGPTRMIDRIGEDRVLFETDFPHPTCLYPRSREHLQAVLGEMPETTRRKVLCDNAASLYGIKVG